MKNRITRAAQSVAAIGIDLGDRVAHYACLNADGQFIEEGTVAMQPRLLQSVFRRYAAHADRH